MAVFQDVARAAVMFMWGLTKLVVGSEAAIGTSTNGLLKGGFYGKV